MGYYTDFEGTITITKKPTERQLETLNEYCERNYRKLNQGQTYTINGYGKRFNELEKTLVEFTNGKLNCYGEQRDDNYKVYFLNGHIKYAAGKVIYPDADKYDSCLTKTNCQTCQHQVNCELKLPSPGYTPKSDN